MVFSSPIFLFLFLPVVFWFNYVIKEEYSNLCLVIASIFFYAWGEPYFVLLMILSITVNWLLGKAIVTRPAFQKMFLAVGMAFNFGLLGYYKYAGFLLGIFNSLLGKDIFALPKARLPIGISFFTFQAVSYLADLYRGETKRHGSLIHTALYISFFPQLIAGPIVKYKDIDSQIASRSITSDGIAAGFRRFIYGLAKKVFVANVLGKSADAVFAMDVLSIGGKTAWMASLLYTFQIYYDFSGYSDMAIGMGRMFGFQIPENFNYPYLSTSIQEFWRRWHISLGAWFRDYVYIPLGGNHKGGVKPV